MTTVNSLGAQELAYLSGMSASQGYQVLNKNMAQSVTNFEKTPQAQSDITYFEQNIGQVKTVSAFLQNTRLVDFVLSAFGLDQEANYQGLIKEVLTQDPTASGSLVNQLSDPRFKQMATALDFYDNGLAGLQAVGLPAPKTASVAEGVTLTGATAASTINAAPQPLFTTTTSINSSIALTIGASLAGNNYFAVQEPAGTSNTIGVSFSDSEYLQLTEPNGTTSYTQSGTFTVNSSGQLALADGSVLNTGGITIPSNTVSVNITSDGEIQATESGQTTPTNLGTLQTTTFTDATQLGTDALGHSTATTGSGTGTAAAATSGAFSTYGATTYVQGGYFTVNSNNQLALSDGSVLQPPFSIPTDTTSLSITTDGVLQALEYGQTSPTILGQLQTASFANNGSLGADALGHYTATAASGAATISNASTPIFSYSASSRLQTTTTQTTSGASSGTPVSVGLGLGGSDYLILQKTDGSTVYAKSAYFTINKNNQLALSDGTLLFPPITLPSGTTGVTVTSGGALYAQIKGQTSPTSVGQLETATFGNAAALAKDKNGYLTPTAASGTATTGFQSGKSFAFSSTIQNLVNSYVQNEFEIAVGNENSGVREALYFQRTIGPDEASVSTYSLATKADVVLGDSVLSNVADTILSQPAQIAYEQLSSQEHIIETGLQLNNMQNTKYVASLTARYLSMYDASNSSSVSASSSPALQILSAFNSGSSDSSSSSAASTILSLAV